LRLPFALRTLGIDVDASDNLADVAKSRSFAAHQPGVAVVRQPVVALFEVVAG
jgi:hypothetical protein